MKKEKRKIIIIMLITLAITLGFLTVHNLTKKQAAETLQTSTSDRIREKARKGQPLTDEEKRFKYDTNEWDFE